MRESGHAGNGKAAPDATDEASAATSASDVHAAIALPDASDASDAHGDVLSGALRDARPAQDNVSTALTRARVVASLFGVVEPVRIGRYEVEASVGAGGGGEVFVARDPELSRRVAIKLMHGGGDRDRLLAEGRALARLSHPNIVPVYDAGALGNQIYVVMELVEGDTLRTYCEVEGRTTREILRAYRQAAEGLAAAHRDGFIHRDFKPDNALIGQDGRVRVVDFGLARGVFGEARAPSGANASSVNVTRAGLGTPRYMAPEQASGVRLTAAADQYAFCASLREGVAARTSAIPRWLDAILRRGMAGSPADRYPSMAALHAALGRDPAWRWRRNGLVAGVLCVTMIAFAVGRGGRATSPSCATAAVELAAAWNVATPAQIDAHLAALATPYAQQAAPHVRAMLERYTARWRDGHRSACVAHRDGSQSAALFDRRTACLARARAALGTAVQVATTSSAPALADAVQAIGALPDLDRCADPAALMTPVAPPAPAIAGPVAALADGLASLEIEVRAARPDVRPRIDRLIAAARGLGYPPLVARALRLAGVAALAVDARVEAIPPLEEATSLALTAGDLALAVEAYARRMWAAGTTGTAAAEGVEIVAALAAGLPESELRVRVLFDNALGTTAMAAGRREEARAAFERALGMAHRLTGPARLEAASVWTNLALVIDDPARRLAFARERIAIVEAALDPDHPLVLLARIDAANLETDPARARAALAPPCARLARLHGDYRLDALDCDYQLGWLALEHDERDAARAAFARAVATAAPGTSDDRLTLCRAYLEMLEGRFGDAGQQLAALMAAMGSLEQAPWWRLRAAAEILIARGYLALQLGRVAVARVDFDQARRYLEAVVANSTAPRTSRRLAYVRASLALTWRPAQLPAEARRYAAEAIEWYRAAGGYDDAIAALTRALAH